MNAHEDLDKRVTKLEENLGVLNVYQDIIRTTEKTNKYSIITIIVLSIFIVVLSVLTFYNQKEFTRYREESITKNEIIEMFESLNK